MKYSKYNYIFKSTIYGFLLYNSESNSFAEIDETLYNFLQNNKDEDEIKNELDIETINALKNARILVDSRVDNYFYKKKLQYNMQNFNTNSLSLAIAPTTFCNFSCFYCFEENRLPVFMNDNDIENLIEFIKKYKNLDQLDIEWYGGEPLVAFEVITKIIAKLESEKSIKFRNHGIISNGYLLTEEKSKYFSKHPLNNIQITIDGSKETHNNRRKLTSGGGTFDAIINNIDVFLKYNENTRVNIRVNLDHSNINEFIVLYNELKKRWEKYHVDVYPAFVENYTDGCSSNCTVLDKNAIVDFYINLHEKHNFQTNYYPINRTGGCGATRLNYYVVGPKGELYKCWNDLGDKMKVIGSISENKIPNKDVLYQYLVGPTMFEDEKCKSCEIFPICDGGCQWMRIQNLTKNKDFNLCSTRKNNMDKLLELHYTIRLKNEANKKQ